MKHRALIIALLLLAGAVVNVGVAWGLVCLRSWNGLAVVHPSNTITQARGLARNVDRQWWRSHASEWSALELLVAEEQRGVGLRIVYLTAGTPGGVLFFSDRRSQTISWVLDGPNRFDKALLVETGFPFRCFAGERWEIGHTSGTVGWFGQPVARAKVITVDAFDASSMPGVRNGGAMLPLRLRGLAAAANSVFFAVVIFCALRAKERLVHRYRRIRGRCPACGYENHQTRERCPECGEQT